jgi:hypothetical protein
LPGNRIVTRYIRPDFLEAWGGFRFSGRGQGKRQQQRRGFQHPKHPVIVENGKRLVTGVVGYLSNVSRKRQAAKDVYDSPKTAQISFIGSTHSSRYFAEWGLLINDFRA